MWTEARMAGSLCWTNPEFPGYEIEKHDDEPFYLVWSPVGPIGERQNTFAASVETVLIDHEAVARAAQPVRDYNWAVREAAAELGCDESEIF
jgi:hypothetical protein